LFRHEGERDAVSLRFTHQEAKVMLIAAETIHGVGDDHVHVAGAHRRT